MNNKDFNKLKICVVGLGYVGLPLAIEFGKQYETIGYDVNQKRIKDLKIGDDKTHEIEKNDFDESFKLSFTSDVNLITDCDVYIITVPTPIDSKNNPDMQYLKKKASESIGQVLNKGNIVIYESTVYPGATEEFCVPILKEFSG